MLEQFFTSDDGLISESREEEGAAPCSCGKFSEVHIHHGSSNDEGGGVLHEHGFIVGREITGNEEEGNFETVALESSKLENGIEDGEPERLSADCSDHSAVVADAEAVAAVTAADN